ncbi:hypothetical protein DES53_10417 [Roseimicrobium gellanilyticum]|uniref:Uncharacterized protein n=1 Tax=Roseimicrobium gellanilyticum TaxID=748857 RepID=A0A366HM22_9BACT|nr:hypothetical protein [Roseimicrobium gellanilyticum]RBP44198.1 hypothetical protein DES53_10417 [Roseimicrobium gellanilyticum]
MAHRPNLLPGIAASVAVTAILAAVAACVVCWLYPAPFLNAFWSCLGGALVAALLLSIFTVLEMIVAGGILLTLAGICIPIAARLSEPALPAYAIASVASGMLSSRAFRRAEFGHWW